MPVLASLLLPRKIDETEPFIVRIAKRLYEPVLKFILRFKMPVLGLTVGSLAAAAIIVASMGTEFVPRLSEGDVVVGILRPAGTHLTESISINTQMEKLLLEHFPDEVSHVWSRMGRRRWLPTPAT